MPTRLIKYLVVVKLQTLAALVLPWDQEAGAVSFCVALWFWGVTAHTTDTQHASTLQENE